MSQLPQADGGCLFPAQGTSAMSQLSQALTVVPPGEPREARLLAPDGAEEALLKCSAQLAQRFDKELGGFGGAPK